MKIRNIILAAAAAATLSACGLTGQTASTGSQTKDGSGSATPSPGFTRFTDIPMPANNTIDLERSLILGTDQQWTGRLVINSGSNVADMYEFYRREMPNFSWSEVTTVRAANSVLVFQQNQRVITIQITPSRGITGGSTVDLTMAPRGGTGGLVTPPPPRTSQLDEAPPARAAAAPRASIDSAPLR
jgi:hypothetical protein